MAKLDASKRTTLPDSAFAYIDSRGKRRLPVHDEAHVRNALARFNQAWFDLGEILYHLNLLPGRPSTEAREAFDRVLDFEPGNAAAMLHLIRLDANEGRIAALDSLVHRYVVVAGGGERALEVLAIQAFAHSDATREVESVGPANGPRRHASARGRKRHRIHGRP